jgi:hypothetical protein
MKSGAAAPQSILDAVDYGSRLASAPEGVVCAIIELESAFNLSAKNAQSKAAGLLQILPEYLSSYQTYAGCAFDPYSMGAAIAGGPIIEKLANIGRSKGFQGDDAIRFAVAAHRYGINSTEAKSPATSGRVLDVEARMKANGVWYDTPQPAPAVPAVIQLPMTLNSCYKQHKAYATNNHLAAGFMIHSNGDQYVPAWHWPVRWNNSTVTKAVHYFADEFGIIEALPDTIQGWHAGGSANKSYLSVEQSEPYHDAEESFAATVKNVRYIVEAMQKKHGFSVSNIIGHYEGHARGIASNHGDPKSDPDYVYNAKSAPWRDASKNGEGYYTRNAFTMDMLRAEITADLGGNPPPPPPVIYPTLRLTSPYTQGPEVKTLQTLLKAKGVNPGPIDGVFGPQTEAAVKKFQTQDHLTVDGIVGPITWNALTT